ncbi:molybdopterin-guanine dinucleotide biosynthesis protein MobB [Erwinia sp. E_sp_B01_3]|uniref:molybdopterin-guanine dinucleotide biosynthesis protein MobB n=1 Tax=unclassified Erwinia TaxID=2622719 RepID=UPI0030CBC282
MIPVLGITAWSGTGKTTLLKQLIPLLKIRGIRPGLIKHTHHDVDVDTPGKDSYELRKAGADQVMVANRNRWALMTETPGNEALDLQFLASRMDETLLDIILVEGFKHDAIPRILLHRQGSGQAVMPDSRVIAVASDSDLCLEIPLLDLNAADKIADFIVQWLKNEYSARSAR